MQSDVSAAEEQRAKVQSELQDVTQLLETRSDELVKVENRIAENLGSASSAPSQATVSQAAADVVAAPGDQDRNTASETKDNGTAAEKENAETSGEAAQAKAEETDGTAGKTSTNGNANTAPAISKRGLAGKVHFKCGTRSVAPRCWVTTSPPPA